ncbi:OmpA family protein [Mesorhizobium sp. M2D.F.Ca.ET.185.01.1.1]|uniref:OmpA family protein n=1 Tax=unclassified Mesorhizobium TaxID=325217 RepID=UPI000FCBCC4A|nr:MULTISPECIES: OmpA family protein [unclassified Mesorhizobium]TGP55393.1 OmpA family protein [bacterium M00.F.Ca.ET.230.01.1.1]TGP82540.1 OmpA family protein [bacterium M00.F.Ca.ET.227.01.1.1]TGP94295.1 OmpA family protein [bacterium M00.F.Ca.ET.221.01.1.1]TGP97750.1 OmpA family protein [bacterium M00.F.Ca.ET.222.01.1.1]TGT75152.1 OmpA family protein [bacterium M00.F.Ca.ET.159.01.1.1]TGT88019.1 OmpA family protein [bacterium M00.F.Ca.ET.157.01.1.1]TGU11940.1 OmpA family protein [bacterium
MNRRIENTRWVLAAGLLVLAASCSTSSTLAPPTPDVTNAQIAAFQNVQPGSEEDFILNVGRRTYFTQGSAALDSVAKTTLDTQIAWLAKYPRWMLKLQGFADDPGANETALSQKRADAVMDYLAAGGIDRNRMWAKGYGKDRLVRDCPDTACRSQNRRVVSNLRDERDEP